MASGINAGGQLVELLEKAVKAAVKIEDDDENQGEETRCVETLKAMRNVPVTTAVLMETQVGKRLRKLTKHSSANICFVAQDLIDAWKKVVATEATSKNSNNGSATKKLVANKASKALGLHSPSLSSPTTKAHTVTKTESTIEIKSSVTVTANKPSANGTPNLGNVTKSGNPTRDRIRELLVEAFAKVLTEAEEENLPKAMAQNVVKVAVAVETALFKQLGLSTAVVNKGKYRSLMFNIKDPKNPDLRRRLLTGEISPEKLLTMSVEDMASDERKQQNQSIKAKALAECERGQKPMASTDQFKCAKCKQRKCTYFQMQTRSADEPMTTFVTCVNCDNRWKFC